MDRHLLVVCGVSSFSEKRVKLRPVLYVISKSMSFKFNQCSLAFVYCLSNGSSTWTLISSVRPSDVMSATPPSRAGMRSWPSVAGAALLCVPLLLPPHLYTNLVLLSAAITNPVSCAEHLAASR